MDPRENLQAIEKSRSTSCRKTDKQNKRQASENVKGQPANADAAPQPKCVRKVVFLHGCRRHDAGEMPKLWLSSEQEG